MVELWFWYHGSWICVWLHVSSHIPQFFPETVAGTHFVISTADCPCNTLLWDILLTVMINVITTPFTVYNTAMLKCTYSQLFNWVTEDVWQTIHTLLVCGWILVQSGTVVFPLSCPRSWCELINTHQCLWWNTWCFTLVQCFYSILLFPF